ncbi:conserved hypothetical protein [uncultured Pleomorphomonas sp.]|uniref:HK97 gp10 family phage protein n=1 Tax=uncultured Pleomorphomonas sp. TaxID=442121 RepID=A0A212LC40_9HYPH|nr:HK97-gp10 family putative phage morphogenesis protein [uncultured Pleomorphomonas sp.]SCM70034.1 conserved hypothetical protein [uncultured Pleomorphomonas sp.]SCM75122.1 conserved hypothetical protein [uncultured Pleomorphomonas sp.]
MADDGGLSRIQRRLNAIPARLKERMAAVAVEEANRVADDMRVLAPLDTGKLRGSIAVTPGGHSTPPYSQPGGSTVAPEGGATITAGNSDVRYAHLVEYGTTKTPAQPFFWAAYRLDKKAVVARFRREARKVIKETWGK